MTMLIHQFHCGSLRRMNKMLAKVLVIIFVAAVVCEERSYNLRNHHEPAKEYRQHYEHVPIRVQEEQASQEVQYGQAPEGLGHGGHAYSSQSIIHHAALGGQQESQESHNEHVAPVYQYVQEEESSERHQAQSHREPAQHYQSIQFVPTPQAHHEEESHGSVQSQPPPRYVLSYQQDGDAYKGSSFHQGAKLHTSVRPPAPFRHSESVPRPAPVHHVAPVQHAVPIRHEEPVHHAVPIHAHDSHDEPIDYYAYPKYQYEYKVEDPHTGDNKFQHETRDGDLVKGVYSLLEADGSYRTVEYSSDKHTGFTAIVKHSAPGQHVQIESHHQN